MAEDHLRPKISEQRPPANAPFHDIKPSQPAFDDWDRYHNRYNQHPGQALQEWLQNSPKGALPPSGEPRPKDDLGPHEHKDGLSDTDGLGPHEHHDGLRHIDDLRPQDDFRPKDDLRLKDDLHHRLATPGHPEPNGPPGPLLEGLPPLANPKSLPPAAPNFEPPSNSKPNSSENHGSPDQVRPGGASRFYLLPPHLPEAGPERRVEPPVREQPINAAARLGLGLLRSAEVVAQQWSGIKYFDNISLQAAQDQELTIDYARKLSRHQNLEQQEKTLTEAMEKFPDNPYFRIYLADIHLGEAAKPIIRKYDSTWQVQISPRDVEHINKALALLGQAGEICRRELQKYPVPPSAYASSVLSPYVISDWNDPVEQSHFYHGASIQVRNRQIAIRTLAQKLNLHV